MTYKTSKNVTPIEMLPELQDLEYPKNDTQQQLYESEDDRINKKYIRNSHTPLTQSGMIPQQPINNHVYEEHNYPPQEQNQQEFIHTQHPYTPREQVSINCIDFAEHQENCPICSKFYNNDRTIYILTIAVVILSILCILLLKKVLDI